MMGVTTDGSEADQLSILCDTHVIPVILFLYGNDGVKKTDIYRGLARCSSIPRKLDAMESEGLITMTPGKEPHSACISLTPKGEEIARRLIGIARVMAGERSRRHPTKGDGGTRGRDGMCRTRISAIRFSDSTEPTRSESIS